MRGPLRWAVFVLAALALASAREPGQPSNPSDSGNGVESLTRENFDEKLQKWKLSLVAFFATWCTESQALRSKFEAAATGLHEAGSNVRLASVEATRFPELRHKHQVNIFPTIKVFINGQAVGEYQGDLTAESIQAVINDLNQKVATDVHAVVAPASSPAAVLHDHGHMIQLTKDTFVEEVGKHQFALVNFGANWCKWTRALLPEFAAASAHVARTHPDVLLAGVDCEQETLLEHRYRIRAFPTLLMFRNGKVVGQYKGRRSANDIAAFVKNWVNTERAAAAAKTANAGALSDTTRPMQKGNEQLAVLATAFILVIFLAILVVTFACARHLEESAPPVYWWHSMIAAASRRAPLPISPPFLGAGSKAPFKVLPGSDDAESLMPLP